MGVAVDNPQFDQVQKKKKNKKQQQKTTNKKKTGVQKKQVRK